ncbi:MAG: terminase small subunit [Candidatus Omnitrophica bacterium]|jgi:phage terminase small subunit|nr:terminase small subunit [Candidatus Omnitrophota bacterium]
MGKQQPGSTRSASKQVALDFARQFFICGVASKAAEAVGIKPRFAAQYGKRYLARQDVQEYLAEARKIVDVKTYASKDRILTELSGIALANISTFVSWGPTGVVLKESSTLSPDDLAMVKEVSEGRDGVKIKLFDKTDALKLLGMEHGMFQKNAVGSKENPLCVAQPVVLSGDSEV